MRVHSLGYRTDLIFTSFDGLVLDRGSYLVIRTPSNPAFYWGNFLLFESPPEGGDFHRWRGLFAEEIGRFPQVRHQTFGWDTTRGESGLVQPFLAAGFRIVESVVLTAQEVRPPARLAPEVIVRPLASDADWEQAFENQVRWREPGHGEASFRIFMQRQMARYRAMAVAGKGLWFGAFLDSQLVADLGIFHEGGIGRFQSVETHPEFRRRGIAGTMVYQAARYALVEFGVQTLVIVANHGSAPARLYQSVGFREMERQLGLEWWEPDRQ